MSGIFYFGANSSGILGFIIPAARTRFFILLISRTSIKNIKRAQTILASGLD
jgi:hypothetical protein